MISNLRSKKTRYLKLGFFLLLSAVLFLVCSSTGRNSQMLRIDGKEYSVFYYSDFSKTDAKEIEAFLLGKVFVRKIFTDTWLLRFKKQPIVDACYMKCAADPGAWKNAKKMKWSIEKKGLFYIFVLESLVQPDTVEEFRTFAVAAEKNSQDYYFALSKGEGSNDILQFKKFRYDLK